MMRTGPLKKALLGLERRLKRLESSVERIYLRREFRDELSVYSGTSPRLSVLRVEMSIERVVKEVMYVRMTRLSESITIYVVV